MMVSPLEGCYAGLTPGESRAIKAMATGKSYKLSAKAQVVANRFRSPNQHTICVSALRKLCEKAGVTLDDERDNKSHYEPWKQFQALAKYHGANPFIEREDPAFVAAVAKTYKMFAWRESRGIKRLAMLPLDASLMFDDAIQPSRSSGLPHMLPKKECFTEDLAWAQSIVAGERKPHPCFAFARIQHGEAGPKQRLVWGFPQSTTLIEATLARPLINLFLRIRTPMVIGYRRFEIAAIAGSIKLKKYQYGLDFSAFDSTVCPTLIGIAFDILGTWFTPSDDVESRLRLCEKLFINTQILMPDGNIYAKKRGIPSGSYFTQLVGSIVNYLALQYGIIKLTGKAIGRDSVMVLGDDSLFGTGSRLDLDELESILARLGLKLNTSKTHVAKRGQPIHFLGHTWVHGVVDRPLIEVAKRLVYPERSDESQVPPVEKVRKRILQYYADSRVMHKLLAKANYFQVPDANTWFTHDCSDLVETGWRKYLSSFASTDHSVNDFPTMGILY